MVHNTDPAASQSTSDRVRWGFADECGGLRGCRCLSSMCRKIGVAFRLPNRDLEECLSGAERRDGRPGVVGRLSLLKHMRTSFRDGVARVAAGPSSAPSLLGTWTPSRTGCHQGRLHVLFMSFQLGVHSFVGVRLELQVFVRCLCQACVCFVRCPASVGGFISSKLWRSSWHSVDIVFI